MAQPQATKDKIGKLDFIRIKNICGSKDTIKKVKRQPTKWEKIFVSRIYKEHLQLNNKKDKCPNEKMMNKLMNFILCELSHLKTVKKMIQVEYV